MRVISILRSRKKRAGQHVCGVDQLIWDPSQGVIPHVAA